MNAENIIKLWHVVLQNIVPIAWTAVGAIALWIIGGWVINALKRLARGALASGKVDATLAGHLESVLGVVLRILLVIAVLGLFGATPPPSPPSFAAVGVAVGMAWSGLLSNFAAGVFLLLLRPIRVGDFIAGRRHDGNGTQRSACSSPSVNTHGQGARWSATTRISSRTTSPTTPPAPIAASTGLPSLPWRRSATGHGTAQGPLAQIPKRA